MSNVPQLHTAHPPPMDCGLSPGVVGFDTGYFEGCDELAPQGWQPRSSKRQRTGSGRKPQVLSLPEYTEGVPAMHHDTVSPVLLMGKQVRCYVARWI